MPKLCPQEDDNPSNLPAASLRPLDTDSNYQKQMSLSVREAKERGEAKGAKYTANKVHQKQREISIKMALCNSGYFFSFSAKYLWKTSSETIKYLFIYF